MARQEYAENRFPAVILFTSVLKGPQKIKLIFTNYLFGNTIYFVSFDGYF